MLPYLWTMTGQQEPEIYLGKKSGKDNIKKWLSEASVTLSEEKENELLQKVKAQAVSLKRDISREEFASLTSELK
jgi:isopropylmalate/homocitrate/citramalate synthase